MRPFVCASWVGRTGSSCEPQQLGRGVFPWLEDEPGRFYKSGRTEAGGGGGLTRDSDG